MDRILQDLNEKGRLVTDENTLTNMLQQNATSDVVLFWFHPACTGCCDAMLQWYRHNDDFGLLRSGSVVFVHWNRNMMHHYGIHTIPSMTVLNADTTLSQPNIFGTQHFVAVHGNTNFANIKERYHIVL